MEDYQGMVKSLIESNKADELSLLLLEKDMRINELQKQREQLLGALLLHSNRVASVQGALKTTEQSLSACIKLCSD